MFIGHYSFSFLAKSLDKSIPLWVLFLAVQFVDVLWAIFVITGIEQVRIIPNFTKSNSLDLYFMPYTHSLLGAIGWSVFAFLAYYLRQRKKSPNLAKASFLVALAVFSHWILDLLVHVPDLGIFDNTRKVGFGLWNYPLIALPIEFLLLIGGFLLYQRSTKGESKMGRYGMLGYVIFLIIFHLITFFSPSPETPKAFAISGLISYLAFAGIAFWLERYRN